MASRIASDMGKLPQEVLGGFYHTKKGTSSDTLRYMQKHKIKPVTPMSEVRKIVRTKSKLTKAPIKITKYLGKLKGGIGGSEGTAGVYDSGKKIIRIHPVVQYSTKKHIESLIDHEISHVKVFDKWKKYNKNTK